MQISDIIRDLEKIAPPKLADDGDKIGLQVGDSSAEVKKILVALDPNKSVIDLAMSKKVDLVVCHHPLIYRSLETLVSSDPVQENAIKLIKADIALYVMHTNYDAAPGGVNDVLAEVLGVRDTKLLVSRHEERLYKIVVFTPTEAMDQVRDAMADAGAGKIGNYSYCSFRTEGTGTFKPLEGSQPYLGEIEKLEEATEYRLEMIVPEWTLSEVIDAMISTHPYEEVAYDVFLLANRPNEYGYGKIGQLKNAIELSEFRDKVEVVLDSHHIRMVGDANKLVQTVAVCSGAGKSLITNAQKAGADVYVTADVGYHDFAEADAMDLAIIDAGHYETEVPAMKTLCERLSKTYSDHEITVEFAP